MYKQELLGGILMDEKFKTKEELYTHILPALKIKRKEMNLQKLTGISEIEIWNYFCNNIWNQKVNLTIGEMVDDIFKEDGINIYARRINNENNFK